jgi:uncharacterized membrane protein
MPAAQNEVVEEGRFFAAISYLGFLCIVSLAFKRDNKFAVFHGKQALAIFVLEVISFILSVIPFLGTLIKILGLVLFSLVSLWGITNALAGKYTRIPLFANIADKIYL